MTTITLNDARVSRRGKGAKGSVEVKLLAKIVETIGTRGKAKGKTILKPDYSEIDKVPVEDLILFIQNQGRDLNRVLAVGFDYLQKQSAIQAQNQTSLLRMRLVAEGLCNNKQAATLANQVTTMIKMQLQTFGVVVTIDSVIDGLKKQKAEREAKEANATK